MIDFNKIVMDQYEKVLKEVLKQILKRDPVIEDAKRLTICNNPNWDYDIILFDNVQIGKITKDYTMGTITITFKPDKFYS